MNNEQQEVIKDLAELFNQFQDYIVENIPNYTELDFDFSNFVRYVRNKNCELSAPTPEEIPQFKGIKEQFNNLQTNIYPQDIKYGEGI